MAIIDPRNTVRDEARALLEEWGKWSRGLGVKGWGDQIPTRRLLGSTVEAARITDDDALLVEKAVNGLRTSDNSAWIVAKAHYKKGLPLHHRDFPFGRVKAERLRDVVIDAVIMVAFPHADI